MSIERCRACAEIERFIEQTEGNSENKGIASGKIDPVSQSASQPAASKAKDWSILLLICWKIHFLFVVASPTRTSQTSKSKE